MDDHRHYIKLALEDARGAIQAGTRPIGSVIVRNGEFTGKKGAGRFIKRSTAEFARLA